MGQQRMRDRGDRFEWSGGHPALDLVNTLDERPSPAPIENLATYRDLTRFAELAGLIDRGIVRRLAKLDGLVTPLSYFKGYDEARHGATTNA